MWTRRRPSYEGPRIKAFARVLASVLFITSFPVAVLSGATPWGWIMASFGLVFGLCLLPSSLMRFATPSGQVTVNAGRHFRDGEIVERPESRRDVSFVIVIGLIGAIVVMTVREAFLEPGFPESWVWAGWCVWVGVNAVYSIDDWWQGWHVPEREAR
ncbi:hypothetical protein [Mycobacteroides salmoniphilum]|uniref:Uncharacterized protein n=1 Tax=Mycobacteroides salmoniphilum TaxID=404941 RepID=A0A4R8SQ09_9MYCO|nr:hypothetical protein [Mycobacteroides salmoniphilum]TDZ91266.1 hypothetical protein CCUG62472_04525 [Mycobacteroides salmoniphilum]TEA01142.1 hypothetical protein CCUG60884_03891 [Mycobacteroides salmoniphilum]